MGPAILLYCEYCVYHLGNEAARTRALLEGVQGYLPVTHTVNRIWPSRRYLSIEAGIFFVENVMHFILNKASAADYTRYMYAYRCDSSQYNG